MEESHEFGQSSEHQAASEVSSVTNDETASDPAVVTGAINNQSAVLTEEPAAPTTSTDSSTGTEPML